MTAQTEDVARSDRQIALPDTRGVGEDNVFCRCGWRRAPGRIDLRAGALGRPARLDPELPPIISVVETCRRLKIPVRDYLGSVLPGLRDFPVGRIAELTPHGMGEPKLTRKSGDAATVCLLAAYFLSVLVASARAS